MISKSSVATTLSINDRQVDVDVARNTPLLWVLRDHLNMTGTKFGCGVGLCGACTVHIDGEPMRSCIIPVSAVGSRKVTTIEAISSSKVGAAVQAA
jgi:isoquinoline 1-oxidoreductase alpha subunit